MKNFYLIFTNTLETDLKNKLHFLNEKRNYFSPQDSFGLTLTFKKFSRTEEKNSQPKHTYTYKMNLQNTSVPASLNFMFGRLLDIS